ncbi:hypothetical protein VTN49DRAFT_153 [Thermomyces lanuginosus]|uniref:uncharacterized protein n=1 Tax=Thermomyces lanuginosus TaxID=5541 RepID=UPI00374377F6
MSYSMTTCHKNRTQNRPDESVLRIEKTLIPLLRIDDLTRSHDINHHPSVHKIPSRSLAIITRDATKTRRGRELRRNDDAKTKRE